MVCSLVLVGYGLPGVFSINAEGVMRIDRDHVDDDEDTLPDHPIDGAEDWV